jgi:HopA1 effector protein family
MHADLDAWLKQVWRDRDRIVYLSPTGHTGRGVHLGEQNPAIWAVYDMYNTAEGESHDSHVGSGGLSTVATFIDDLDQLERKKKAAAIVQVGNSFVPLHRGELASVRRRPLKRETTSGTTVSLDLQQIGKSFVHFAAPHDVTTKHRVYLNVRHPHRGEVFRRLVVAIWDVKGLASAKVSGPLDRSRADSVVVYLSDEAGRADALRRMRPVYDRHRNHFGAATPKLTVPIEGMPGVSTGMEPPSLGLVRSGGKYYGQKTRQSFGFYRASLIFMALDRTHFVWEGQSDAEREEAFRRRAVKYFRQAGIDPDRPAEQYAPGEYLPIEQLKVDIEGEIGENRMYRPGTKVHVHS